ncbi:uncharacterized protein LOC131942955 [Physella acuta]|uniref:uncharacterized protein LOC131942955 n=1 Tax=Physella acuta TaxID=109671 RepID=UPI0027DD0966|nr:uncharacterized protein LOC131942955 [Physella acuta]
MKMDKTSILLLLLLPVLTIAFDAEAIAKKKYTTADINGDGDLTVDEISKDLLYSDKIGNNNGVIDKEEYKTVFLNAFKNSKAEAAMRLFAAYDVNNDTVLDDKDFGRLRQKMNQNNDAKLTQQEYVGWILPYIKAAMP